MIFEMRTTITIKRNIKIKCFCQIRIMSWETANNVGDADLSISLFVMQELQGWVFTAAFR